MLLLDYLGRSLEGLKSPPRLLYHGVEALLASVHLVLGDLVVGIRGSYAGSFLFLVLGKLLRAESVYRLGGWEELAGVQAAGFAAVAQTLTTRAVYHDTATAIVLFWL